MRRTPRERRSGASLASDELSMDAPGKTVDLLAEFTDLLRQGRVLFELAKLGCR
jgi:hypothetical protein